MTDRLVVPLPVPVLLRMLPSRVARKLGAAVAAGRLPAAGLVCVDQQHDPWCGHWQAGDDPTGAACTCDPEVIAHWWPWLIEGGPGVTRRCP
jgi:hypothetical protein